MINYSNLDHSSDRLFEDALQKVEGKLEIKRIDTHIGLTLLSRFDELKKYQSLFVHKVTELKGNTGSFIILLVEKHQSVIVQKRANRIENDIEEVEPVLIFNIPQDIGKAYIRNETMADKLLDVFSRVDIDFGEYPHFSKNYYVIGEKPDLIKKHFPKKLMESMGKIKDLTIEVNGNWGLLRSEKNLTENVLMLMISIGYNMTK